MGTGMERFTTIPNSTKQAVFRMPTAPTSIIGRTDERCRIRVAIRDGVRLVTLIGTGGVGKTRLAIAAGEDLQPEFEHRVGWVSLGELNDQDRLLDTIALTLDINDDAIATNSVCTRPAKRSDRTSTDCHRTGIG